jgi:hypothetical protein
MIHPSRIRERTRPHVSAGPSTPSEQYSVYFASATGDCRIPVRSPLAETICMEYGWTVEAYDLYTAMPSRRFAMGLRFNNLSSRVAERPPSNSGDCERKLGEMNCRKMRSAVYGKSIVMPDPIISGHASHYARTE